VEGLKFLRGVGGGGGLLAGGWDAGRLVACEINVTVELVLDGWIEVERRLSGLYLDLDLCSECTCRSRCRSRRGCRW
jgi:hypothetical protein